jgi:hypothetical protein
MIKRQFRFLTLFICAPLFSVAQIQNEYEKHLQSIRETSFPINYGGLDSMQNGAKVFVEYTTEHLLQKPSDKYFISNRNLLEPLNTVSCDTVHVKIQDTLKNGKIIDIRVRLKPFDEKNHTIRKSVDSIFIFEIDNKLPYGAAFNVPRFEITEFAISINGKSLLIPKDVYTAFYRVNMCPLNNFYRGIEAYESLNGEYIYLYIFGGSVGDVWYAKLVFDHEKYITSIIADYYVLNLHDSFKESFIGF